MNNATDFRYMWTLSAGEAEPPQSGATKTYAPAQSSSQRHWSNKVRPTSSLRGLDFLAYPAGVATFHYNQLSK